MVWTTLGSRTAKEKNRAIYDQNPGQFSKMSKLTTIVGKTKLFTKFDVASFIS